MQRSGAVLCGLVLYLGVSTAWAKGRKPSDSPRYEPPKFDELPSGASEAPGAPAPAVSAPATETPVEMPHIDVAPNASAEPAPAATEAPAASNPPIASATPDHYSVRIWQDNGDCLWRIAEKVYGDRSKWRLIYLANKNILRDPNKVYPKQKLKIPPSDWQP
jgi:nucleoid-associated protein YgaU